MRKIDKLSAVSITFLIVVLILFGAYHTDMRRNRYRAGFCQAYCSAQGYTKGVYEYNEEDSGCVCWERK